ncbi:unnamed protein product [Cylicocyclus nassatus]|uniref:Uncharacterized protein n=1 Tax=Cylicocyclus nassatus TaxID=53992 RepID=A0AA36M5W3_CYLNA|nr:unnamed protein product [Cylicocyclus nassatus]
MTTTVRAYKGLMTKRSQVALAWLEESTQRLQHLKEESTQQEQVKEFTMTVARCDEYLELLEASLTKLTEAFDKLQDTTDEEEDQLDKHAEIAQETIMKGKLHIDNLSNSSLDNEATEKTVVPTGTPVVNELEPQADSNAPLSSPTSHNVQPPSKRPPVVIAGATISKDKFSPSSSDANLYMHPSVHATSAEAHMKPAVVKSLFSHTDINDDTPSTKFTAESDAFTASPYLSLNVFALMNEVQMIHKAWEELLDFKEDVKRQQQEILHSIQRMNQHLEILKAWNMKDGTDVIRQKIPSKLAKKKKAYVRRRNKSSSEEKKRNIPAAPTLSQKREESIRSCTKPKRRHTKEISHDEERKQKIIAQRQRQMRTTEQNPNHLSCTGRPDVNVSCKGSRKQRSDACSKLRTGTRRDVQHRKTPRNRCVEVRHSEDRTGRRSCFYCRNTRGNAVVLNHHTTTCRLLENIAHKQRNFMRQAKTFKNNMKLKSESTQMWREKKGTEWNAKKRRPKTNGTTQTQLT